MPDFLTASQMGALERKAMASGAVTGEELMERAGRGVVSACFEMWPELANTSFKAVVLCGPGNNGGDGYVVARLLAQAGWDVVALALGDPEELPPDALTNARHGQAIGKTYALSRDTFTEHLSSSCDLVVDGLFGSGLNRAVEGLEYLQEGINNLSHAPNVVAIDVPSGLSSDTGTLLGPKLPPLCADLTVTFHSAFQGHVLAQGPEFCGALVIHDIGLHPFVAPYKATVQAAEPDIPALAKQLSTHKFSHGHALLFSGGAGKTGAARLAARGALRIGAGLVTLGCPPEALPECAAQLTAVMIKPVHDGEALRQSLEDPRISALCVGPNFGLAADQEAWLAAVLASKRPVVLDADALTLIGASPALFAALHEDVILTPHLGEFTRVFPKIAAKLSDDPLFSKVDATIAAAKSAGCTVLLKGADTVIAGSVGKCRIHAASYERAAPWLATAGAGDVLAGFITGLLARGFAPFEAAETGAWLHAECARQFGAGLIAEDLSEELPRVFRGLGV